MKALYCFLLIPFAAGALAQEKPQFGIAGEGYTAAHRGGGIELGWRMFTAPMAGQLCGSADEQMTLESPAPLVRLAPGDAISLDDLQIHALDRHGNILPRVPITVGIPAIEDGVLDYSPYELTLTARKVGRLAVEVRGICVPGSRLYLSLLVVRDVQSLSLGAFSVSLPDGWQHATETQANGQVVTRIFHPKEEGVLQIGSILKAPRDPSPDTIRRMTNVDSSVDLCWQSWGELKGYQHDYSESGKHYRQWWLVYRDKLLFVVYSSTLRDESLRPVIDDIVRSLAVSESQ